MITSQHVTFQWNKVADVYVMYKLVFKTRGWFIYVWDKNYCTIYGTISCSFALKRLYFIISICNYTPLKNFLKKEVTIPRHEKSFLFRFHFCPYVLSLTVVIHLRKRWKPTSRSPPSSYHPSSRSTKALPSPSFVMELSAILRDILAASKL